MIMRQKEFQWERPPIDEDRETKEEDHKSFYESLISNLAKSLSVPPEAYEVNDEQHSARSR